MSDLAVIIARYADRFHTGLSGHHIASPLGAWMLTALAAGPKTSEASDRAALEEALGLPLKQSFKIAHQLLKTEHPAIRSAAAVWNAAAFDSEKVHDLQQRIGDVAQVGGIPSQQEADQWTVEKTMGLLRKFPLTLTEDTLLVFATALATKIKWKTPFEVLPENTLGFGKGDALHSDMGRGHHAWLQDTEEGIMAVHLASSEDGLAVYSVIADPSVSSDRVLAQAHKIALREQRQVNLHSLALGQGHSWNLREDEEVTERTQRYDVVLPAWEAKSEHDLLRSELGLPVAAEALQASLRTPQQTSAKAVQAAVASYGAEGFEAAAVSTLMIARSAMSAPTLKKVRHCDIRFDHAYAVVAVAEENWRKPSLWDKIPVFSAWVAE